jgi:hypothetical protein
VNAWTALLAAWAVLELSAPPACRAHDPGLSSTVAEITARGIEAGMRFNDADVPSGTAATAERVMRVWCGDRELVPGSLERHQMGERHTELRVFFPTVDACTVSVRVPLLAELPFGHKHYLEIRRDGAVVMSNILSAGSPAVAERAGVSLPRRDGGLGVDDGAMIAFVLFAGFAGRAAWRPR